MRKLSPYYLIACLFILLQACATSQYIHDQSSYERQKELCACRSNNIFSEIMMGFGSICSATILDVDIGYYPDEQQFKKLNLINATNDTMYVNMLTDVIWDKEDYCDFMDIRIPPNLNCKVMVPVETLYNLYYSTTPESNDDEIMQIYTSDLKNIELFPGITSLSDSIVNTPWQNPIK